MNYFVTGATGFIGRHLVDRLLAREGDVYVLVREGSADKLEALIHPDFVYVNAAGRTFNKESYIDTYCTSGRIVFAEQRIDPATARWYWSEARRKLRRQLD